MRLRPVVLASVLTFAGLSYAHAQQATPAMSAPAKSPASFLAGGYLPQGAAPDSRLLNPPPPAPGSAALARDEEAAADAVARYGTPRWDLATRDADLFTPSSTRTFACAAGIALSLQATPHTQALLLRAARDLGMASYPTKLRYQRARPFMENGKPECTPQLDKVLRHDGSYPSGHSAIGYGWGLILAELIPTRVAELVARGRAFGDSRRICNVHWLSDVEEGRVVAAAVVARLHAEPAFRADLDTARAELSQPGLGAPAPADCTREAAALGRLE